MYIFWTIGGPGGAPAGWLAGWQVSGNGRKVTGNVRNWKDWEGKLVEMEGN